MFSFAGGILYRDTAFHSDKKMARAVGLTHTPPFCTWDGPGAPDRILCFESICDCYNACDDGTVKLNGDECNCENLVTTLEKAQLAFEYMFKPESLIKFQWRDIMNLMLSLVESEQVNNFIENSEIGYVNQEASSDNLLQHFLLNKNVEPHS